VTLRGIIEKGLWINSPSQLKTMFSTKVFSAVAFAENFPPILQTLIPSPGYCSPSLRAGFKKGPCHLLARNPRHRISFCRDSPVLCVTTFPIEASRPGLPHFVERWFPPDLILTISSCVPSPRSRRFSFSPSSVETPQFPPLLTHLPNLGIR